MEKKSYTAERRRLSQVLSTQKLVVSSLAGVLYNRTREYERGSATESEVRKVAEQQQAAMKKVKELEQQLARLNSGWRVMPEPKGR